MDQDNVEGSHRVPGNPAVLAALRAVPDLNERLRRGIHVVDIGCGRPGSTLVMAGAFPRSRFLGVDPDAQVVERARRLTTTCGLRNVYWLAASVGQLASRPKHDLICAFDGLHGAIDARDALGAIRAALADDGLYLWSKPSGHARDVWEVAKTAGFSRVDTLRVDATCNQLFALRK